RMRLNDPTPRPVIHRCLENRIDVLDQGSIAPDVEGLRALAYSENRLEKIERVLEQQLVHRRTARIRRPTLRNSFFPISLWIDVEAAPWKQHTLNSLEQPGHAILALVQRNHYRRGSGRLQRRQILRQSALVIFR